MERALVTRTERGLDEAARVARRRERAAAHRPRTSERPALSADAEALDAILAYRTVLPLDRYGLIDLKELGLSRTAVFRALRELMPQGRLEFAASRLGDLVLRAAL